MSNISDLLAIAPTHEEPIHVTAADLDAASALLNFPFPTAYRDLVLALNGLAIDFFDLYRPIPESASPDIAHLDIVRANAELQTDRPKFPKWLVAFYANGGGDFDCFDRRNPAGRIMYWDHEIAWDKDCNDPDDAVSKTARNFDDWIAQQITHFKEL
jgi:hypothetical protein